VILSHVRQAVLADLDELAAVFDQYRQFQGQPADLAACRAFLHQRFGHGDSVLFLATRGAQAVGMAQLYPSWSSTALARVFILNDLFVAAAGRRGGRCVRPAGRHRAACLVLRRLPRQPQRGAGQRAGARPVPCARLGEGQRVLHVPSAARQALMRPSRWALGRAGCQPQHPG